MKLLNLYSPPTDLIMRMKTRIKPNITDRRFLELEIKKWLSSNERRMQIFGEEYYEGRQSILRRKRTVIGEDGQLTEVKNLPNFKIVDNQYAKMVDQKSNYLCGKPMTFDCENKEYSKALEKIFDKRMQRTLRIAAEKALTGGKVWISPYYSAGGELRFALIPAHEMLPFWADAEHTELDCAVHLFPVFEYDGSGSEQIVMKAEVFHAGGIERFIWEDGALVGDNESESGAYVTVTDSGGKKTALNWDRIPLVCFKRNHRELPLLNNVKCLQDALNEILSNFMNCMSEDVRNTVIVLKNYDGENLGEFRRNLATFGAIKVRSFDGEDGGVEKLEIAVDTENYKLVTELLKKAIIENARGYDAKDERMSGTPNQMNIRSMYSDIDLDANGMETEFQAAIEELLFFVCAHLKNTGQGSFDDENVRVIFNRDMLVNESEAIEDCAKSAGLISNETIVKQHPWIDDPEIELERMKAEKESDAAENDIYGAPFAAQTAEGKSR